MQQTHYFFLSKFIMLVSIINSISSKVEECVLYVDLWCTILAVGPCRLYRPVVWHNGFYSHYPRSSDWMLVSAANEWIVSEGFLSIVS